MILKWILVEKFNFDLWCFYCALFAVKWFHLWLTTHGKLWQKLKRSHEMPLRSKRWGLGYRRKQIWFWIYTIESSFEREFEWLSLDILFHFSNCWQFDGERPLGSVLVNFCNSFDLELPARECGFHWCCNIPADPKYQFLLKPHYTSL